MKHRLLATVMLAGLGDFASRRCAFGPRITLDIDKV